MQHANPRSNARRAAAALDRIRRVGGRAGNSLGIVGGASGQMTPAQIVQLSRDPFVSYISLDAEITPAGPLGAPLASLYTEIVRAPEVWGLGYTCQGITIAIVDSGMAPVDDFKLPTS